MKRTARGKVGSALLQSHEVTYDLLDPGRIDDLVYRFIWNHILLLVHLFKIYILHLLKRIFLHHRLLGLCLSYFIFVNRLLHLP